MSMYSKGTCIALLGADTVEKSVTTHRVKLGYQWLSLNTTEQGV
jgi:hypothetical protein